MEARRQRRWHVFALIILGLLLALGTVAYLIARHYVSEEFASRELSKLLGEAVHIETIGVYPGPTLRVRAEDVSIGDAAKVRLVEARLAWAPLFARKVVARSFFAEGLDLELDLDAGSDADPSLLDTLTGARLDLLLDKPRLVLKESRIRLTGGSAEISEIEFEHLNLSPIRDGRRAKFHAKASLGNRGELGRIELRASISKVDAEQTLGEQVVEVDLDAFELDAKVVRSLLPDAIAEDWHSAAIDLDVRGQVTKSFTESLKVSLRLPTGTFRYGDVTLDGPTEAKGLISFSKGRPVVEDGSFRSARAAFAGREARKLEADFSLRPDTLDLKRLAGRAYVGEFEVQDLPDMGPWFEPVRVFVRDATSFEVSATLPILPGDGPSAGFGEPKLRRIKADHARLDIRLGEQPAIAGSVERFRLRSHRVYRTGLVEIDLTTEAGDFEIRTELRSREDGGSNPDVRARVTCRDVTPQTWKPLWSFLPFNEIEGMATVVTSTRVNHEGARMHLEVDLHEGSAESGALTLLAPLRISGDLENLRGEPDRMKKVRFEGASGTIGNFRGEKILASASLDEQGWSVESLTFRSLGGLFTTAGTVGLEPAPLVAFTTRIRDVAFAPLPEDPAAPQASDYIHANAEANLRLRWHPDSDAFDALSGNGRVDLTGGRLKGRKLIRAAAAALRHALPLLKPSKKATKVSSYAIKTGTGEFAVEEGKLRLHDVELITEDYALKGGGWLETDGNLEFDGDLRLTARGFGKTAQLLTSPVPFKKALKLPALPVRLEGPLTEMDSLKAQMKVSRLPVAALRSVLSLPGRAGSVARGVGSAAKRMGKAAIGRGRKKAPDADATEGEEVPPQVEGSAEPENTPD